MAWLRVLGMAMALGTDAMSVSAAVGVRWHGPRQKFRLAWHMGLFQFLMPVLGYLAGSRLAAVLAEGGAWVGALLVFAVGAKMLYEGLRSHPGAAAEKTADWKAEHFHRDPTRGWSLVGLSVATSVDALVVGVSLGLEGGRIWLPSIVIGIVAGLMSLLGVVVGQRIGAAVGRPAEIAGALVLIALAVSFVVL